MPESLDAEARAKMATLLRPLALAGDATALEAMLACARMDALEKFAAQFEPVLKKHLTLLSEGR